jgi:hypothetical protein
MSAPPPDPPEPLAPPEGDDEPPRRRSAATLALGILIGVAAVVGVWTLLGAGVCAAMLGGVRG